MKKNVIIVILLLLLIGLGGYIGYDYLTYKKENKTPTEKVNDDKNNSINELKKLDNSKDLIYSNTEIIGKLVAVGDNECFETKEEFEQYKSALKMVKEVGYGIAIPTLKDMKLDTPEVVKQGGRYGVKLKAVAPSIHMIRVDVESTFEPIIGSELQSKELINYLTKNQEESADSIWKSEIFGRSLDAIVQEGIQAKLSLMPDNLRYKLQSTLCKVVNKGSNNMIAIVL